MALHLYNIVMQLIALLCIGSIKDAWVQPGLKKYIDRLQHDCQFELIELPDSKERDPQRQMADESQRILAAIDKRDADIWLLDETGKEYTSSQFADVISQAHDHGRSLLFIIGGAYGVNDTVRARADHSIALSQMTLPHELCRLLFLEQLYRSMQINKGSGYHH